MQGHSRPKMLNVLQQLRRLAVTQLLGGKELLQAVLLRCLGALDEGFFKPGRMGVPLEGAELHPEPP